MVYVYKLLIYFKKPKSILIVWLNAETKKKTKVFFSFRESIRSYFKKYCFPSHFRISTAQAAVRTVARRPSRTGSCWSASFWLMPDGTRMSGTAKALTSWLHWFWRWWKATKAMLWKWVSDSEEGNWHSSESEILELWFLFPDAPPPSKVFTVSF